MDSIAHYYREINGGFLNKNWHHGFEIYYKVEKDDDDEPQFLKFADYTTANHARIKQLMENDDRQEFFIHETELVKYYKEFLIGNLKEARDEGGASADLLEKAYHVAVLIMKEYFENIGSPRVLRTVDEVIAMLEGCLAKGDLEFFDVFKITDKTNHSHTHCVNLSLYSMTIFSKLKMKPEVVREVGLGAMLCDIGKKSVPYKILNKTEELTPDERKQIRKHPSAGKKILNDMKCYSENILRMAAEHHEKFSGEGYPFGLAGEKISLYARMAAIIDCFNAMTSERAHRKAITPFEALNKMKNEMPGHFDDRIFVNFVKILASKQVAN